MIALGRVLFQGGGLLAPLRWPSRAVDRGRWRLALIFALTVLLVASLAAATAASRSTTGADATRPPAAWPSEIVPLVRYVEQTRGLAFSHPVEVRETDPAAFDLLRRSLRAADRGAREDQVLAALGIVGDATADAHAADLDSVDARYDSALGVISVRGELSPATNAAVVGALTTALLGQHFPIATADSDPSMAVDSRKAALALRDGDVARIVEAYVGSLDAAQRNAIRPPTAVPTDASPRLLYAIERRRFGTVHGRLLVQALVDVGGNSAIDRAYANPPVSTAEVLEPGRYLARLSGNGTGERGTTTFGAFEWFAALAPTGGYQAALPAVARLVVDDVVLAAGGCVDARLTTTEGGAPAWRELAKRWSSSRRDLQVSIATSDPSGTTPSLSICQPPSTTSAPQDAAAAAEPGIAAAPGIAAEPGAVALQLLSARATAALRMSAETHKPVAWSRCVVDARIAVDQGVAAVRYAGDGTFPWPAGAEGSDCGVGPDEWATPPLLPTGTATTDARQPESGPTSAKAASTGHPPVRRKG